MGSYDPIAAGALCNECPLRGSRVVPPEGPGDADLVIVGEGPGAQEVKHLKPFIGPSGMVLDEILYAIGLPRRRVWISNTLLCRAEVPHLEGKKKFELKTYLAYLRVYNMKEKKQAKIEGREPKLLANPIDCCTVRLWSELWHFEQVALKRGRPNGAVIIPCGNYAAQAVTGKLGIMRLRGSPIRVGDVTESKSDQVRRELYGTK